MSGSGSLSSGAQGPVRPGSESHPAVTAHAGALGTPRNTPQSFRAALAYPIDYLEADVRFTPESVAYLSHDALPPEGQAGAMKLTELLDIIAPHPSVALNLDMKEVAGLRGMVELIRRSGMGSRVLLTGVTAEVVGRVREQADGLPYLLNARPGLWQRATLRGAAALVREIRECGARGLNAHYLFISGRLARALRAAGLSVSVWTVDAVPAMRRLMALPVDNITTNHVDQLLALRGRRDS